MKIFLHYNKACHLAAIAGTTILVPYHVVTSATHLKVGHTRRWNLQVTDLQMSGSETYRVPQ